MANETRRPRPADATQPDRRRRARRAPGDTLRRHARRGRRPPRRSTALRALADEGFGDGDRAGAAPAPARRAGPPPAAPAPAAVAAPARRRRALGRPGLGRHRHRARAPARRAAPARRPSAPPTAPERERERLDEALAARARGDRARPRGRSPRAPATAEAAIFDAHLAAARRRGAARARRARRSRRGAARRARVARRRRAGGRALPRARRRRYLRERAADVARRGAPRACAASPARTARRADAEPGIVVARELTPAEAAGLDPALVRGHRHRARLGHLARRDPRPRARPARPSVGLGEALLAIAEGTAAAARRRGRDARRSTPPTDRLPRRARSARERPPSAARARARARPRARRARATARASRSSPTSAAPPRRADGGRARRRGRRPAAHRVPLPRPRRAARRGRAGRDAARDRRARSTAARSSCARSTPAPTSRCRRCPCRPRPTRSSACAASASALARPELLRHAAARDPARGRRAPGQGDVPDGRHARRGPRGARAARRGARGHGHRRAARARDHGRGPGGRARRPTRFAARRRLLLDRHQRPRPSTRWPPSAATSALAGAARPARSPRVLRLIARDGRGGGAHGRWVGVCGELAGDPAAAVLLAGLGVTRAEHGARPRSRRSRRRCARSTSPTRARRRDGARSTPRTPMRRADWRSPCSEGSAGRARANSSGYAGVCRDPEAVRGGASRASAASAVWVRRAVDDDLQRLGLRGSAERVVGVHHLVQLEVMGREASTFSLPLATSLSSSGVVLLLTSPIVIAML